MPRHAEQLRADALRIWHAGLAAVRSERLVADAMHLDGRTLVIGDEAIDLDAVRRIAVVGAGKAGAGMARAVEAILGPQLMEEKHVVGWVNVPADCAAAWNAESEKREADGAEASCSPLPLGEGPGVRDRKPESGDRITLHPARPPGVNEPTPQGVIGAERILEIVQSLGPDDLCLCLISGGGSALLPAPVEGITLDDKLAATRFLSGAGANIEQLNTVRRQLSRIKGGRLARACRAARLVALLISDVLGDPLEVIASGPTVESTTTAADALAVLDHFAARKAGLSPPIFEFLERAAASRPDDACGRRPEAGDAPTCRVTNLVIGNNARAVDAAGMEAERLGYAHAMISATHSEGPAEDVGRHLAEMALRMRGHPGPNCLISGGEPVVSLIEAAERGLGGRNQQLVLAALERLWDDGAEGIVILSGGTDGEDGPTDAAGAWGDAPVIAAAKRLGLDPADYLRRNDAYRFFEPLGALLKTGPTHTNVCDVRVVLVERGDQDTPGMRCWGSGAPSRKGNSLAE